MRRMSTLVLALLVSGASLFLRSPLVPEAHAACPSNGQRFEPADGEVIQIIGQDRDAHDAYVEGVGIVPGGFMVYINLATPALGTDLPLPLLGITGHARAEVEKYPQSVLQIGMTFVGQDDLIPLGLLDANIRDLAARLKGLQVPIFLRVGYEFQGYQPEPYKASYKRIVDVMRQEGVTNVAYVWHSLQTPSAGVAPGTPLASYYPGDAYVDWVGVSMFGDFSAGIPAGPHEVADFADAHGKPLMIAEATPKGRSFDTGDTPWATWFVPVFDFIEQRGVKAFSFINMDWNVLFWQLLDPTWTSTDSRIETNQALEDLWVAEISQAKYLKASPTLFCEELGL